MQVNVQVLQQSRQSRARAIGTITKRTTGATDGPKSLKGFCLALLCQLAADRLAGCRRVDARFTLAVWNPGLQTHCLLDIGPVGRLSLSALVAVGTRHCWRGMARETTPSSGDDPTPDPICSPDETSGSCMKFRAR